MRHTSLLNNFGLISDKSKIAWLRLARTRNIGARTFFDLLRMFVTPEAALEQLPNMAKRGGAKKFTVASIDQIEREIDYSERFKAKIILLCEDEYPFLLRQIFDPPPVIVVRGDVSLLEKKQIAIVGARNASTNGCIMAKRLAQDLSRGGYVITSGLAKGIDASAHAGALACGTIGVIAGGIDHVYPKENEWIYKLLYEKGLVVTEQAISQLPIAKYFPQRNRIIAGMSQAIVIVEAAKKSGTLITARLGLEYGREVFAVPGSPLDLRYQGTNGLIKQGAVLVEDAEDVLREMVTNTKFQEGTACAESGSSFSPAKQRVPTESELEKYRGTVLNKLSFSPVYLEDLIEDLAKVPTKIIHLLLLELELAGRIERTSGNRITLIAL